MLNKCNEMKEYLEDELGYDLLNLSNKNNGLAGCICREFQQSMSWNLREKRAKQPQAQRQPIHQLANCKDFYYQHRYAYSMDFMEEDTYEDYRSLIKIGEEVGYYKLDFKRQWPIERD